ncbi:hypothetical protein [Paraburkholderia sp. J8-2]|uniref:hypothetical protein n=1 Tax=Paraburkholderia sp. J8-2 TaxID=2805440 RepID=UPI002AB7827E|nr:hypothetical protein [Paraburkholderia sp. J8-2]
MGEANRRKAMQDARTDELRAAVAQVAHTLSRLASAASSHLGADCYVHAALGQVLLTDLGFDARLAVGEAAFRLGPGDGDVVSHTPRVQGYVPEDAVGFGYHAWLVVLGHIVDFTTYQLAQKARDLDKADGGKTQVDWCPPWLMLPFGQVKNYNDVANSVQPGDCFYLDHPKLHRRMQRGFTLDAQDVANARYVFAHPEAQVLGPQTVLRGE